jgi:hypothetical protein
LSLPTPPFASSSPASSVAIALSVDATGPAAALGGGGGGGGSSSKSSNGSTTLGSAFAAPVTTATAPAAAAASKNLHNLRIQTLSGNNSNGSRGGSSNNSTAGNSAANSQRNSQEDFSGGLSPKKSGSYTPTKGSTDFVFTQPSEFPARK